MKKYLFALAAAALAFAACDKTEEAAKFSADVVLVSEETSVPMPETFAVKVMAEDQTVVFDQEVSVSSNESVYSVAVNDLLSGIYTISVSGSVAFGGCNYVFSGSAVATPITAKGQKIEVALTASKEAALLFKEIYYAGPSAWKMAGSNDPYKDDNFYEIYNNSSVDMYLDGLCIANCAPTTASEILSWELSSTEYVFAQAVWQFPGNGTDYVIKAGKSVVLASVPIDHTKLIEGSLDLTTADFEFFVENQNIYADNTSIPNMILKFGTFGNGADRYLPTVMGPAMILFRPEGNIDNATWVSPVGKEEKCKEIPVSWVIDGVEAVQQVKNLEFKRLPASIDGGAVYMKQGIEYSPIASMPTLKMTRYDHTSVSFCRKYKNGTDITGGLVDTNNSTEDFVDNAQPVIRRGL